MAIVAVFQHPSLTKERYDESARLLTGGRSLQTPADWPIPELLAHVTGQGPIGFRVVDVWESEDAFRKFGEKLIPRLQSIGVEGQPEIYPAHTVVMA